MISGKSFVAIITARGGSKGIPDKNIKILNDKPLIAWTIEAARKSEYIDRVIVSTDSSEIAKVSIQYGAEIPFMRPAELATDSAKSSDAIIHALNFLKENEKRTYDYFVLLQPTSPLRNEKHINEAIEIITNNEDAVSLVSVREAKESPYLMKTISENGYLNSFINSDYSGNRRQDLPGVYMLNGAIYISKVNDYLITHNFYSGRCLPYIMNFESSIDIDDIIDFHITEFLFKKSFVK